MCVCVCVIGFGINNRSIFISCRRRCVAAFESYRVRFLFSSFFLLFYRFFWLHFSIRRLPGFFIFFHFLAKFRRSPFSKPFPTSLGSWNVLKKTGGGMGNRKREDLEVAQLMRKKHLKLDIF